MSRKRPLTMHGLVVTGTARDVMVLYNVKDRDVINGPYYMDLFSKRIFFGNLKTSCMRKTLSVSCGRHGAWIGIFSFRVFVRIFIETIFSLYRVVNVYDIVQSFSMVCKKCR